MVEEHLNALPSGHELGGYRIERILGAGGFGVTYLAEEISLGRPVAIKEYLPSGLATRREADLTVRPISESNEADYRWGLERFKQEAATLVNFDHPNIIRVHRYFEENGTAYLVMPWIDGETLDLLLSRAGALEEDAIRKILDPLLDGLARVHEAGFLHRDIKPGNILLRTDGTPVLIDFGAARQALGEHSQALTAVISDGYAPYEQYENGNEQGPSTDLYAVGAVLYRCIGGPRPISSPSRISARVSGLDDPLSPAARVAKRDYSETFLAAIDWALSVTQPERPQTVASFSAALAGTHEGTTKSKGSEATSATINVGRVPDRADPLRRPRSIKAPAAIAAIAAAIALILVAGGVGYWQWDAWKSREAAARALEQRHATARTLVKSARDKIRSAQAHIEAERYLEAREAATAAGADARKAIETAPDLQATEGLIEDVAALSKQVESAIAARVAQLLKDAQQHADRNAFTDAEAAIKRGAALLPEATEIATARRHLAMAKSARANALVADASAAIKKRELDRAEDLLAEAAKLAPGSSAVQDARTSLKEAKARFAEAERRRLATDPDEVLECDRLAGDPWDERRNKRVSVNSLPQHIRRGVAPPTDWRGMVVTACRTAIERYPSAPRFKYQLASAWFSDTSKRQQAISLLRDIAGQSYPAANARLGWLLWSNNPKTFPRAISRLEEAEPRYPAASFFLGVVYERDPEKRDLSKALGYFKKAYEQKVPGAAITVGQFYRDGKGVKKDYSQAAHWFRRAASLDDPDGAKSLATLHFERLGYDQELETKLGDVSLGTKGEIIVKDASLGRKKKNGNQANVIRVERIAIRRFDWSHWPPHALDIDFDGVSIKFRDGKDTKVKSFRSDLDTMGIKDLRLGHRVSYIYDQKAKALDITIWELRGDQFGSVRLAGRIVSIEEPALLLIAPASVDFSKLSSGALARLSLTLDNRGGLKRFIALYAKQNGQEPKALKRHMRDQLRAARKNWPGPFGRSVTDAAIKFLDQGGQLSLSATPAYPVPFLRFTELSSVFSDLSPQKLDSLGREFNIRVEVRPPKAPLDPVSRQ